MGCAKEGGPVMNRHVGQVSTSVLHHVLSLLLLLSIILGPSPEEVDDADRMVTDKGSTSWRTPSHVTSEAALH